MLARLLPVPGQGPGEKTRRTGFFRIQIYTRTSAGARYAGTIEAQGDPGYAATSVMLGETALCLALDRDQLPGYAGVLTPATAMGAALAARLRSAGQTLATRQITQLPRPALTSCLLIIALRAAFSLQPLKYDPRKRASKATDAARPPTGAKATPGRRQKRTTALVMAMYKYSGRLTIRRARNRGCHAANGTGPYVDNRALSRRSARYRLMLPTARNGAHPDVLRVDESLSQPCGRPARADLPCCSRQHDSHALDPGILLDHLDHVQVPG
jgi:hypothetical protein